MNLLEILLGLLSIAILVPIVMLFVECSAAVSSKKTVPLDQTPRPAIAVLLPAHNEASGIRATLDTIQPQLTPRDRLVVVADNCTDDTAAICRSLGATVIERHNLEQRGKGYALAYGVKFLEANPPETVVLLDADCNVHPGMIDSIARLSYQSNRPVQCANLLYAPSKPSAKDRISAFAFTVKNLVRPQGLSQFGLPCLLSTGVAFPWWVLRHAPLASSNIAEDMQMAVDLAIAGHPALFCSSAQMTGMLPKQKGAAKTQRTRWEHGHIQTLLTQVPRLLKAAMQQRRWDLLSIALDLSIPPLSLLVLLWAGMFALSLIVGMLTGSLMLPLLNGIGGVLLLSSILLAWARFARAIVPLKMLLLIPFYVLWKIPVYFAFLVRPQKEWIRTMRESGEGETATSN